MKSIIAFLVCVCLLSPFGLRASRADEIPPGPQPPERPKRTTQSRTESIPIYAISAGVVAVTLTGSLVALRVIRKRNDKQ